MKAHTHRCTTCLQKFECTGELSRNHDGWPEVVCSIRHDVSDPITECPSCYEAPKCAWCGGLCEAGGQRLVVDGEPWNPSCAHEAMTRAKAERFGRSA